jgi:hypothetical protein
MLSGRARQLLFAASTVLVSQIHPSTADAGCGCDKPPPPPAQVRPAFASPGQTVTLFGADVKGGKHTVTFTSRTGESATVTAHSDKQRDLADGVEKRQLEVAMPAGLPLGPASIRVEHGSKEVLSIDESQFTVLQAPLRLDENDGITLARCYRAAVDAAGTVYFPFDVGAIKDRMVFSGIARGYPLLFTADDVTIHNTQGFLMQLLAPEQAGTLYAIQDPGSPHSFELIYDRHEFVTYASEHVHEADLALDRKDPRWHVDGTPHVDHDHLVLAIDGRLEDGSVPPPGATPAFELSVVTSLEDGAMPTTRTIDWSADCTAEAAD